MVDWIRAIPPWFWIAVVAHLGILGTVAYMILLERKIASWVQDRVGPNRVGPFGLLQPIADGLKFFLKEDYRPKNVDRILFTIAPAMMILAIIVTIAVLPWGGTKLTTAVLTPAEDTPEALAVLVDEAVPWWAEGSAQVRQVLDQPGTYVVSYAWPFQIADLNIGVLFILALLGLAVYGVVIGGWASNNKYSFLGGLRATANMISYEIPLGLAIITTVILFGTLELDIIVAQQARYWLGWIPAWNVFCHPVVFLLFLICIHAEANRAPFDTAEAEQELVGGYHTEYSSMRFALFFLAEYAGMITTSAVCVALFFGGWHIPWVDKFWPGVFGNPDSVDPSLVTSIWICILRALVFFAKTLVIIGIFMWVRWSLPRFRFDQILDLAWRAMIPITLALTVATTLVIYFFGADRPADLRVTGGMALALLIVNLAVLVMTMLVSTILPAGPPVNRRIHIEGSRFTRTPLPAARTTAAQA